MKEKYRLRLVVGCLLVIVNINRLFSFEKQQLRKQKPNLLIILPDQWRSDALGFLGREKVRTPHLDSLSKKSYVLTQMVANYPLSSPSRATLLTGKYPQQHNVYSNVNSKGTPFNIELDEKEVCWSDLLKSNGYFNGYIGKWHLDAPQKPYVKTYNNEGDVAWNEWTPKEKRHGFDYWYSYGTYDRHLNPMYWSTDDSRDEFTYVNEWGPIHEADKAIAFLSDTKGEYRDKDKPFSLVVSMNPPHSVYTSVPKKYYEQYKDVDIESLINDPNVPPAGTPMGDYYRKNLKYYYANITGVDEQTGRILNALKINGLEENTLVVFLSDHGNCLGKHNEESKNNFFEESVRVPLMIYWKGKIKPHVDQKTLMSMVDMYPTILDLLDINYNKKDMPGTSMCETLTLNKNSSNDYQFLIGKVKASDMNSGFRGVRTSRYKLVYSYNGKKMQGFLYDLQKDPFELENLFSEENIAVSFLTPVLKKWIKTQNDPFLITSNKPL